MTSICTPSPDQDDEYESRETWMIFVDSEAGARASTVIALAYRQHLPIRAKETCFGLMMEGEKGMIRGFMGLLRDEYPAGLYLKRRPFSISDTKVCARTFNTRGFQRAVEQFKHHNRS